MYNHEYVHVRTSNLLVLQRVKLEMHMKSKINFPTILFTPSNPPEYGKNIARNLGDLFIF